MKNNRSGWAGRCRSLACFAANRNRRSRPARVCGDDCRCRSYRCSRRVDGRLHRSLAGCLPCRAWNDGFEYRGRIRPTKEKCWWRWWIWIRAKAAGSDDAGSDCSSCRWSSCRTERMRDAYIAAGRRNRWDPSNIRGAGHPRHPACDLAAIPSGLENAIEISGRETG